MFFDDWNKEEWDYFYSFMIYCCQYFIQYGITKSDPLHLNIQKLRETIGREIADYFIENLVVGTEYDKNEIFNRVQKLIPEYKYKSQRVVTSKVKQYSEMMGLVIREWHSGTQSFLSLENPS